MAVRVRSLKETEFTAMVIQLASLRGWRTVHFRPARTASGWRTPCQGDARGFVDLVLCRERVIYVELKTDKGTVKPEQQRWIDVLRGAGQEIYVWRPKDWDRIMEVLE